MGSLQSPPMVPPSPARLFATLAGVVLFTAGIVAFFFDLSWLNYLYVAGGVVGLLAAGRAPGLYALCLGAIFTVLAIVDFSSRGWPHLVVGLLGLAAFAATRGSGASDETPKKRRDPSRPSKPRAKTAKRS
jgi:hypothetical protein